MTRAVAVIPARSGSKRIALKNVKEFCGKPLLAYSVEAAIESGVFERVIVSTDSPQIAETATSLGAEAPYLRSASLSDDQTPIWPVLLDALERLPSDPSPDLLCCIYATAPLICADDIRAGRDGIATSEADAAVAVTTFPFPVQRALCLDSEERLKFIHPEHELTRSQDLSPRFHDAGQFTWLRSSSLRIQRRLFMKHTIPVYVPRERVQDIDDEEDWRRAEVLYRALLS